MNVRTSAPLALALLAAALVAACGGGGGDATARTSVDSVKVFGDSLADSGTFGYRFTVQSGDAANPFLVFPERIAAGFGVAPLCPFFKVTASTTFAPQTACTNFAVGGGRVNNLTNAGGPSNTSPQSITYQLQTGSATLKATDFVLIDGGSNDLADILGAYLGATTQAGVATYVAALGTLLPPATVGSIVGPAPTAQSLGQAGGAYAQALGKTFVQSIKANVLAKGVKKVLLVNSSDFTLTPRFQAILGAIAAGPGGAAQAGAVQGLAQAWIGAFNQTLAQEAAGTDIQIFDFNAEGARIFKDPAQFGITNVKTPACPVVAGGTDTTTGQASLGSPATVAVCNPAYLSTHIPAGETSPDWWKSYAFSDNFHPTPALHQLVAQAISLQLARLGWLN